MEPIVRLIRVFCVFLSAKMNICSLKKAAQLDWQSGVRTPVSGTTFSKLNGKSVIFFCWLEGK